MTEPTNPTSARSARGRWQVGLRTLVLLVCAVAAWLGVMMNRARTVELQARLTVLRSLARELEVDDPARIAAVEKLDQWMDENRWDVYIPPGSFRICMSTRNIAVGGLPPLMTSAPIAPGRHRLALDQRTDKTAWRAVLACDGSETLTISETSTFSGDSASRTNDVTLSEQFPADQPLVLYRRRFSNSASSAPQPGANAPSDGLMIWLEPAPAARHE